MADQLSIRRGGNFMLTVKPRQDGLDLKTDGGRNITAAEYDKIAAFAEGRPGADAFLEKLRNRMAR